MGLIYLVRKKKFRTAEGIRELYFAIQRKLQKRGGKNEEDLAEILSANSSRSKGEVLSILTDLPDVIEEILKNGESVSIRGLGSFHASITSNGFEHPEDVLPHEVRVSKVYFIADRKFTQRVSRMKFFRYTHDGDICRMEIKPNAFGNSSLQSIEIVKQAPVCARSGSCPHSQCCVSKS